MPPRKRATAGTTSPSYTVPGVKPEAAGEVVAVLQDRLNALNDLALTLKHVHWNVVGPHFIAVHQMLDPQVDAVREMVDDLAERIATLGGSPVGTPGALVAQRSWDDYSIGRADTGSHLAALDIVYTGVLEAHRAAIEKVEESDPVTEDLLVQQTGRLERYHWFVRAHLESPEGTLLTAGVSDEKTAAKRGKR
ncbi:Dps family protein [Actinoplanes siamensis]|uniref:DNA starvation/stationary phase protection protein n=1 Tax=Actinoplanes siamensis TaxID=1223317 RepID=A0A919N718_9ACTN|nr:DNA starvation/stationary phase protection protein [Actinoplanes siamensis]GIF05506.1 DNA starvation/stationary phase protection protein [Actinoplanes siamensis]